MSVHITPHKNGWQVLSDNADKAFRVVDTQQEAIDIAKQVSFSLSHTYKSIKNY